IYERLNENIIITGTTFRGKERCCIKHPHNLFTSNNPGVSIIENLSDSLDSDISDDEN
ncbi:8790_t:CDS:2, partial [Acaulospora morrowiae]